MGRGAILPPVSTAERHPAAPADTPQRSIAVTAIPLVHGASIRIRSIAEAKPAPAAARLPTIMPTIRMIHVPFAAILHDVCCQFPSVLRLAV